MSAQSDLKELEDAIVTTAAAVDAARATGDQAAIDAAVSEWNAAHQRRAEFFRSINDSRYTIGGFWRADEG